MMEDHKDIASIFFGNKGKKNKIETRMRRSIGKMEKKKKKKKKIIIFFF